MITVELHLQLSLWSCVAHWKMSRRWVHFDFLSWFAFFHCAGAPCLIYLYWSKHFIFSSFWILASCICYCLMITKSYDFQLKFFRNTSSTRKYFIGPESCSNYSCCDTRTSAGQSEFQSLPQNRYPEHDVMYLFIVCAVHRCQEILFQGHFFNLINIFTRTLMSTHFSTEG